MRALGGTAGMRVLSCCAVAVLIAVNGCTSLHPQVSLEPGVSLKDYHLVAIGPVTDRSGFPFDYNIGDSLRAQLGAQLLHDGVPVAPVTTDTTAPVLFVVSSLDGFKNGALAVQLPTGMGTSRCVLSSRLMDGHSGRRLGEIVSSEISDPEDTPVLTPQALLATCARMTADEIKRLLS